MSLSFKRKQQQGSPLLFATCIEQKKNLCSDYFKANNAEQTSVKGVNIQIIIGIFFSVVVVYKENGILGTKMNSLFCSTV